MLIWIKANSGWITLAAIAVSLMGLAAVGYFVVRMPADYFLRPPLSVKGPGGQLRSGRLAMVILGTTGGVLLLLLGLVMCLPMVPGPGLLIILLGLSLMQFPGKRALELRILRLGPVLRTMNRLRAWAERPPLVVPVHGT